MINVQVKILKETNPDRVKTLTPLNPMEFQMKVAAAKVKTKDGQFIFVDLNRGDEMSQDQVSEFLKKKFPDKPVLYRERLMIGGSVQYSGHTQFVEHVRTVPLNSFSWKLYRVWE